MARSPASLAAVLIVRSTVVGYAVTEGGENEQLAPGGRPVQVSEAAPGVPAVTLTSDPGFAGAIIDPSGSELYFRSQSLLPFPLCAKVGRVRT